MFRFVDDSSNSEYNTINPNNSNHLNDTRNLEKVESGSLNRHQRQRIAAETMMSNTQINNVFFNHPMSSCTNNSNSISNNNNQNNSFMMTSDKRLVDDMLSKELQQLSFQDRNAINEEVHGVRCLAPPESPQYLQESLHHLKKEISMIHSKIGYNYAITNLPTTYVTETFFQLRFLRAELFDIKKAAIRLCIFCDLCYDFFGPISLQRPIQWNDLLKEDIDAIREGDLQPLPFRDRSGRRVLASVNNFSMQYSIDIRIRITLYVHWALSEDIESQRRGFVGVFCWPNSSQQAERVLSNLVSGPNSRETFLGAKLFAAIPLRLTAVHVCFPDKPVFHLIRSGLALIMGDKKSRLRFHCGDSLEIQYNLQGYGIPADQLPVTETGNVKTKNLLQWIRVRKIWEGTHVNGDDMLMKEGLSTSSSNTIECPGLYDVIFRCGQAYLSHPGNVMFRGLVEQKFGDHNEALTSEEKVSITWWVMNQVERKGGRFLVWDNGWWKVMSDRQQIRSKIASAFKDQKRRIKALSNCQMTHSSTYNFERQDGRKRKRLDNNPNDTHNDSPATAACWND